MTEYDAIAIDGYTYDSTDGDPLTGVLNSNKVVNVYYVADETDIRPRSPPPAWPEAGNFFGDEKTQKIFRTSEM